jgi:cell division protein FtsB
LEKKTSKLKNDLDLDLLDQQSRIVLGLIRNDEIMIIEK